MFPLIQKSGVENIPFQVAAKRLEIDENVNMVHSGIHLLALN